jgi:hypothetical protein
MKLAIASESRSLLGIYLLIDVVTDVNSRFSDCDNRVPPQPSRHPIIRRPLLETSNAHFSRPGSSPPQPNRRTIIRRPPPETSNAHFSRPGSSPLYVLSCCRTSSFMKVSLSVDNSQREYLYVLTSARECYAHNDIREFSEDQLYLLPVKVHGFDIRRKACISPLTCPSSSHATNLASDLGDV